MSEKTIINKGEIEVAFRGKICKVIYQDIEIIDGNKVSRFKSEKVIRSPGTRLIIVNNKNQILLTKEYRHEIEDWDYRLPGGKVFDKLEDFESCSEDKILESAKIAAKKELEQETGLTSNLINFYYLSKMAASTIFFDLYYFEVNNPIALNVGQELELGEHISIDWYTFDKVKEMCLNRKISEDRSVGVLFRYILNNY
ncbi:MAG: NUDIX domain-containing protein [archaeon]